MRTGGAAGEPRARQGCQRYFPATSVREPRRKRRKRGKRKGDRLEAERQGLSWQDVHAQNLTFGTRSGMTCAVSPPALSTR